ncbi:hypothetical protein ON010_g8132 [Phytophthora cinnamomi]|nr:hypothetical protein ON010_g8132 [Phytophthora cinnamomi]
MNLSREQQNELLFVGFNQDSGASAAPPPAPTFSSTNPCLPRALTRHSMPCYDLGRPPEPQHWRAQLPQRGEGREAPSRPCGGGASEQDLRLQLLRGADRAEIYSICFSPTAPLLACSSDKGTVHVFSLTAEGSGHSFSSDPTTMGNAPSQSAPSHYSAGSAPRSGDDDGTENSKSSLSFMRGLLPKYFSSEWSFAQFRVPETRTICAFGTEKNTIVVVGADGSFYKAVFDANGECQNTSYSKFIQSDEDE